ncbi:MAG: PQQ-dependent sugar dehydrogenase [bacterium]
MKSFATLFLPLALVVTIVGASVSPLGAVDLTATRVASGLTRPTFVTAAPGDPTRLFILEQWSGSVWILDLATETIRPQPFITQPNISLGTEQGLLGMAFHPDYPATPYVYLSYTRSNNASRITRYTVSSNPDSLDFSTAFNILTVTQPQPDQNGGWIGFGPEGFLYVALGDGGGLGDDDIGHDPLVGNGQSLTTRLGKILRLDVDGGSPYAVPATNPFFAMGSPANEIWAYGLRNPWRPSFDRMTGDFYIADVGVNGREEVSFQAGGAAGGANYGWREFQGSLIFNCPTPCDSSGHVRPIHEYSHGDPLLPCAIIGGYAYRGSAIPELAGHYFFGDLCSNQIWTIRVVGGVATNLTDRTADIAPGGGLDILGITSFGEDADGEIYICDNVDGEVWKIIPDPTSVSPGDGSAVALGAAWPNPTGAGVRFAIRLPSRAETRVAVHDLTGRRIRRIADEAFAAGSHTLAWDGRDESGAAVAAGVYLLRVENAEGGDVRKVTIVR